MFLLTVVTVFIYVVGWLHATTAELTKSANAANTLDTSDANSRCCSSLTLAS